MAASAATGLLGVHLRRPASNVISYRLEFRPTWFGAVAGREAKPEPIASAARDEMDVNVRHLLAGGVPVRYIHAHRLHRERGRSQRAIEIRRYRPEPREDVVIQFCDECR